MCIRDSFHPVIGLFEVDAVTTLITQTPYDDRRVIDKTFHITFIALDVSLEILREPVSYTHLYQVSFFGARVSSYMSEDWNRERICNLQILGSFQ